jgi:superfamily II DNA/RNA helicase
MPFKKLTTPLKEVLEHLKFETATPFQQKAIPKIKSGANVFGIGPDGCGKTTTLIINTLHVLNNSVAGDNPRALIFVKDKTAALQLEEDFNRFIKQLDLRIFCVSEEQNRANQRDTIYYGVDIVIATPKRLLLLYHLNGINLNDLKLMAIEDAHLLPKENFAADIIRIPESLGKCQYLVFSNEFTDRIAGLQDSFMEHSVVIKLK